DVRRCPRRSDDAWFCCGGRDCEESGPSSPAPLEPRVSRIDRVGAGADAEKEERRGAQEKTSGHCEGEGVDRNEKARAFDQATLNSARNPEPRPGTTDPPKRACA